jgi:hypothetical protein
MSNGSWRFSAKKKIDAANTNDLCHDPQARKDALDEQARQTARMADACVPPHSSSFPF